MKSILSGIVVTLVIGVVASFALSEVQRPSYDVYSSDASVRIGDPGSNLILNPEWRETGNEADAEAES